jgi:hypothetical protein
MTATEPSAALDCADLLAVVDLTQLLCETADVDLTGQRKEQAERVAAAFRDTGCLIVSVQHSR